MVSDLWLKSQKCGGVDTLPLWVRTRFADSSFEVCGDLFAVTELCSPCAPSVGFALVSVCVDEGARENAMDDFDCDEWDGTGSFAQVCYTRRFPAPLSSFRLLTTAAP